ncbi:MAG UNVERIFIED_CONTAM: hypothetical protein LVQ98_06970 [Rickettsiaceae bacterium]|jgi:hypothetical protein
MTTIVFDLDDTLCSRIEGPDEIEKTTRNNPECILINWHHQGRIYPHLFIPYIGNLIEYLLQAGARIVFSALE